MQTKTWLRLFYKFGWYIHVLLKFLSVMYAELRADVIMDVSHCVDSLLTSSWMCRTVWTACWRHHRCVALCEQRIDVIVDVSHCANSALTSSWMCRTVRTARWRHRGCVALCEQPVDVMDVSHSEVIAALEQPVDIWLPLQRKTLIPTLTAESLVTSAPRAAAAA